MDPLPRGVPSVPPHCRVRAPPRQADLVLELLTARVMHRDMHDLKPPRATGRAAPDGSRADGPPDAAAPDGREEAAAPATATGNDASARGMGLPSSPRTPPEGEATPAEARGGERLSGRREGASEPSSPVEGARGVGTATAAAAAGGGTVAADSADGGATTGGAAGREALAAAGGGGGGGGQSAGARDAAGGGAIGEALLYSASEALLYSAGCGLSLLRAVGRLLSWVLLVSGGVCAFATEVLASAAGYVLGSEYSSRMGLLVMSHRRVSIATATALLSTALAR